MSDLPPHLVNPHHTGRAGRRHRSRTRLTAQILAAVVMVGFIAWWAQSPRGAGPPGAAMPLQPSSENETEATALSRWIESLKQKGIVPVPLTEVVKARLGPS
jgi:hypothetical protein